MACHSSNTPLSSPKHYQDVLKSIPFFSGMDEGIFQSFLDSASMCAASRGEVLCVADDEAEAFYVMVSGWVKLFRTTLDGGEAVIDVLTVGHLFGEIALFEQEGCYPYSAEIIEDAILLAFPMALLQKHIKENHEMALQMLKAVSQARLLQDREIEHRTQQTAPQRIGCFLLRLCKRDAVSPITIHLPYDKGLLAARLGMKPETFSRALTRLQQDIDITIKGATVQLNSIEELSRYACSACSGSYPCQDL